MTVRLDQLTFEEGLDLVANAAYPLGLLKRAEGEGMAGLGDLWNQIPESARNVLVPTLAGAGIGGLSSLWQQPGRRKPVQRAITGAGLGALLGGGMQLARGAQAGLGDQGDHLAGIKAQEVAAAAAEQQAQQQAQQANNAAASGIVTGQQSNVSDAGATSLPLSRPMAHGNERLQTGVASALGLSGGERVRGTSFLQDLTVGPNGLDAADANPVIAGAVGGAAGTMPWWATKNQALRAILQGPVKDSPVGTDNIREPLQGANRRLLELGRSEGQALSDLRAHGSAAPQHPRTWGLERLLRGGGHRDLPPGSPRAPDLPGPDRILPARVPGLVSQHAGSAAPAAPPPAVSGPAVRGAVSGIQSVLPTRSRFSRTVGGGSSAALSYLLSRLLLNHLEGPAAHGQP